MHKWLIVEVTIVCFHGKLERKVATIVELQPCTIGEGQTVLGDRCKRGRNRMPGNLVASCWNPPPMSSYSNPSMSFLKRLMLEWLSIEVTSLRVMNCKPPRIVVASPRLRQRKKPEV